MPSIILDGPGHINLGIGSIRYQLGGLSFALDIAPDGGRTNLSICRDVNRQHRDYVVLFFVRSQAQAVRRGRGRTLPLGMGILVFAPRS